MASLSQHWYAPVSSTSGFTPLASTCRPSRASSVSLAKSVPTSTRSPSTSTLAAQATASRAALKKPCATWASCALSAFRPSARSPGAALIPTTIDRPARLEIPEFLLVATSYQPESHQKAIRALSRNGWLSVDCPVALQYDSDIE